MSPARLWLPPARTRAPVPVLASWPVWVNSLVKESVPPEGTWKMRGVRPVGVDSKRTETVAEPEPVRATEPSEPDLSTSLTGFAPGASRASVPGARVRERTVSPPMSSRIPPVLRVRSEASSICSGLAMRRTPEATETCPRRAEPLLLVADPAGRERTASAPLRTLGPE
jgi:hypothetical protein